MTDLNLAEIKFLLNMANKQNVIELEYRGIKIKFKDRELIKPLNRAFVPDGVNDIKGVPDTKADDLIKPLNPLDDLTPEEILYYAVPHYDQIQAEKEAHKKKLEDEKINGG